MIRSTAIALLCVVGFAGPAQAWSAAAQYLVDEQIREGCEGPGHMEAGGVIDRDLTGDGNNDLIINHDGIVCDSETRRSLECGAANCSVKVYVREGKLLVLKDEALAGVVRLGQGKRPVITLIGQSGTLRMRWNGKAFEEVK